MPTLPWSEAILAPSLALYILQLPESILYAKIATLWKPRNPICQRNGSMSIHTHDHSSVVPAHPGLLGCTSGLCPVSSGTWGCSSHSENAQCLLSPSDNACDLEAAGRATDGPEVCPIKPRAEYLLDPLHTGKQQRTPLQSDAERGLGLHGWAGSHGATLCATCCVMPGTFVLSLDLPSCPQQSRQPCAVCLRVLKSMLMVQRRQAVGVKGTAGLGQVDPSTSPGFATSWLCGHGYNNPTEPQ